MLHYYVALYLKIKYTYINVYIYIWVCMYAYICLCLGVYMYVRAYVYVCGYIYMNIYSYNYFCLVLVRLITRACQPLVMGLMMLFSVLIILGSLPSFAIVQGYLRMSSL